MGQSSSRCGAPQTEVVKLHVYRETLNTKQFVVNVKAGHMFDSPPLPSLLLLNHPSRSHLVPDVVHHRRWVGAGRPEPWRRGGGPGDALSHSDLHRLLPPVPLQPLQHHDGGEQGRRPELGLAQKPLGPDRSHQLCSRARNRHPGERMIGF